jgi:hypothetical protein
MAHTIRNPSDVWEEIRIILEIEKTEDILEKITIELDFMSCTVRTIAVSSIVEKEDKK